MDKMTGDMVMASMHAKEKIETSLFGYYISLIERNKRTLAQWKNFLGIQKYRELVLKFLDSEFGVRPESGNSFKGKDYVFYQLLNKYRDIEVFLLDTRSKSEFFTDIITKQLVSTYSGDTLGNKEYPCEISEMTAENGQIVIYHMRLNTNPDIMHVDNKNNRLKMIIDPKKEIIVGYEKCYARN